jgi:uncharacterized SAM-binding protein YcdF (DUF218 family)
MTVWAMFFTISKLFWYWAAPSQLLVLLVLMAVLCLVLRRKRAGLVLGVLAGLLWAVADLSPLPFIAMRAIEDQYPRPPSPSHVDGILILGSGFNSTLLKARGAPQTNAGAYRLVEGFIAARHHPEARVVFSGGSGALRGASASEAETARYVLEGVGLDPSRLILEARSRNTYENILFSKQMVKPKPGEVWLLATSAAHMPRAMAIARKQGWLMLPWPTDYITLPEERGEGWLPLGGSLGLADYVVHEWIGLIAYRLTGKAA